MTSTSLFDGYLSNAERLRQGNNNTPSPSVVSLSFSAAAHHSLDDRAHPPPPPAMSQLRFGPEVEHYPQSARSLRDLHAMEDDDEDGRDDDANTTVVGELDDPAAARTPRTASSTMAAAPHSLSAAHLADPPPPKPGSSPSRSVSSSQKHSQTASSTTTAAAAAATTPTQPQSPHSRKPSSVPPPSNIRIRHVPRLPNHTAERLAPCTIPYWSRAPVYGALPTRCMRAHTVTLIDNIAWQVGGCDHQSCSNEVLTFDIETMQWGHPDVAGDVPPPCRAHSATQVDRRIFIFGGGEGPTYYNHVYVLDTAARRWHKAKFTANAPEPIPRRAHATWYYQGKIYLFGGGNGARALNDLWTFEVGGLGHHSYENLRWERVEVQGNMPGPRGYHTANLINNSVVVIGGSDGSACFDDIWVLNLERLTWHEVKLDAPVKRLSHTSTQVGSYLFVMGGHDGSKYNHELLLFNLVTLQWETRDTRGRYPSSRGYHAAILADSRLFVIGGFDGHTVFDDAFILDLAAAAYLPQVKSFDLTLN